MVSETGLKGHHEGESSAVQVAPRGILLCKVLALLVLLSLSLYPCALRAQTTNASVTGRVKDPSKASIVDAKVGAVSTGTNFRYESTTDGACH
jgi:hypothetical protein